METITCSVCHTDLPSSEFLFYAFGPVRQCHRCRHKTNVANQDSRARKAGVESTLTAGEWQAVREQFGHKCALCGEQTQGLEIDHIDPISRGGANSASNVQPLCRECNNKKRAKKPEMSMLTSAEVAERLGIGKSTVTLWCNQGRFPNAEKRGRDWLIPVGDVEAAEKPSRGRPPKKESSDTTKPLA